MVRASTLAVSDIAELVIALLAEEAGKSSAQMRAELAAAGRELPVDSLLIAEIMAKVEDACGVRLHVDAELGRATRSVISFARCVHRALEGADGIEQ